MASLFLMFITVKARIKGESSRIALMSVSGKKRFQIWGRADSQHRALS